MYFYLNHVLASPYHVLASPFAFAYPEWQQRAAELSGSKRSFVVIDPSPPRTGKLLSMSAVEYAEPAKMGGPARVFNLTEWKNKMIKKSNGNDDELPQNLSEKDMVVKIMNLTTQEGISDKKLRKILDFVERVLSEPDKD